MPANNSKTNRSTRRQAALSRFTLDPARANDEKYQERKAQELASLEKTSH